MDFDIANPDPAGTISSLRSFGYSVEAAVADLVDNSIAAAAQKVDVAFTWDGASSWVAVIDDGRGMDSAGLVTAMTVAARGTTVERDATDLGRFGMGLKTASFSQAARLTVATTPSGGNESVRTWDLSVVAQTGQWRLLHGCDPASTEVLAALRAPGTAGTVVLWRQLHRFASAPPDSDDAAAQKQFYSEVTRVEAHLGMVFGRLLGRRGGLSLLVNGVPVRPWDPFLTANSSVQRLPTEHIPVGAHAVRIEPFILPHPRRLDPAEADLAAGPAGWLDHQGFYVYRRNRLILAGDWLGIRGFRRDERYNLARIAVDVPAEADADWAVDVRKSSAVPPIGVRRHLQRIGSAARTRAVEVLRHRGRIAARSHGAEFIYTWLVSRHEGRIRCRINREHPLVREVLRGTGDTTAAAKALIRLLEETVPVETLRVMHESDTADDPEPFLTSSSDEVAAVADRIFAAFVSQGHTPGEARRRMTLMPPFDQIDGFWRSGN
ncbi:ATP-binding protein [Winogradskya humida]|uniref:ATPase n=1 Tax=Winogradskya humida TaxID=113566 RepID=A0ABQ3ZUM0_9ACTN|nr:ATP-binding protein [Actinoplanes humidus]GIE22148.1 ATPase [Actinoplanes humidus]